MTGPGNEIAAAGGRSRGGLRASHAERDEVTGILKAAFVQGRLTEDEFHARIDQVYASRTYAELAEVTADIPIDLTGAQSPRDPWRATKMAWRAVYAILLPGIVTLVILPGGPRTTAAEVVILTTVVYLLFWILGVSVMVASRPRKRSGGQRPLRSVAGADG